MKEVDKLEENNKLKRIDSSYIIHEMQHLLHLESGFLFTVKELFIRPGKLVRSFIFEDRSKATKPIIFLIFSATLFTLVFHFFHIEYQFISLPQKIESIDQNLEKKAISDWINNHIGYASLMIGFLIALWIKVFFRNHNYNIYEITILLCYCIGQLLLILLAFSLLEFSLKAKSIAIIGVFIGYFYVFWSIGQFFGEKKIMNYVKSIMCCFLGAITFSLILIVLAIIFYQLGIK
jgi:hypothetical protein